MQTLVLTALAVAVVGISESWGAAVIRNINDPKVVELSTEITHHASNDEVLDFIMEVSSHVSYPATHLSSHHNDGENYLILTFFYSGRQLGK